MPSESGPADKISPKVCNHVAHKNHPHLSQRKPCGHCLLREIVTKSGKKFYPLKSYCYYSVKKK